jgi:hypothetical protein
MIAVCTTLDQIVNQIRLKCASGCRAALSREADPRKLRPKLPESLGLADFHAPRVTRRVMGRLYAACDRLLGDAAEGLIRQMAVYPAPPVSPHNDAPDVWPALRRALERAGHRLHGDEP